MHSDDQAFLERLITRLRELESLHVHEHNQAILEVAREALLDAIAEVSLRIEEARRAHEDGGRPPPPQAGNATRGPNER